MKRLVCLLLCFVAIGSNICNAKVFEKQDDFTGGKIIISHYDADVRNSVDRITLKKIIGNRNNEYEFAAAVKANEKFTLANRGAQINIDKIYSYEIPIINRMDVPVRYEHIVSVDYQASAEIIEKLQSATRVAFRFTQNNGFQFVYVLPDEALEEWKQVIATED